MKSTRRPHPLRAVLFFLLSTAILSLILVGHAVLTPPVYLGPSLPTFSDGETEPEDQTTVLSRAEGVYTALLLGKDTVGENTDVILLASFDVENKRVSLLQIPRDTFIRYSGRGIKLGTLYSRLLIAARKEGDPKPRQAALEGLKSTLSAHLSIPIDYHLLLDLDALRTVIDAMGGVTVNVPCDMHYDDPAQALSIHLSAGKQHLDGEEALQFVRFRAGYANADLGRLDAQKLFLAAVFERARSPIALAGLAKQLPSLLSGLETNATLQTALYFLGKLTTVKPEHLSVTTLRGESVRLDSGTWYYVLGRAAALADLNETVNPFTAPLDDSDFDKDAAFTDSTLHAVDEIYRRAETAFSKANTDAASLNKDGLLIPPVRQSASAS